MELMIRCTGVSPRPDADLNTKKTDSAHSVIPPTGEGFNSGAEDVGVRAFNYVYMCTYICTHTVGA